MNPKLLRMLNVILCLVSLLYGSLASHPIPGEGKSTPWQIFHNSLHIPCYALLTFLLVRYFTAVPSDTRSGKVGMVTRGDLVAAGLIALGYGILMEILQGLTPDRTPSLMDVGLNALGVGIVAWAYYRIRLLGLKV